MKKIFYVFACAALLLCACDKDSLNPDNGSTPSESGNGSEITKPSGPIVLPSKINDATYVYGQDGRIIQHTNTFSYSEYDETFSENYSYTYALSGSIMTETETSTSAYGNSERDKALVFVDGHIVRWIEMGEYSYDDHYYEYDNGYLTLEEYRHGNDVRYINYIWKDSCLSKITKQDCDTEVYAEYEFVYGDDKNPYYGLNFDPTAIWLSPSDDEGQRWKMLGLMGKNSKKLPVSVKFSSNEGERTENYSITYKFSSGALSEICVSMESSGSEYEPVKETNTYVIENKTIK